MTSDPWCEAGEHATRTAYRKGCRCSSSRALMAAYAAARRKDRILGRPRLVDATGTSRRLKALHALGWTGDHLGQLLGTERTTARHYWDHPFVTVETARRVAVLYDQLSMKVGPSAKTRNRARKAGWPPPLAWDDDTIDDPKAKPAHRYHSQKRIPDEVAVLRRGGGDSRVRLTLKERREMVTQLHALGLSDGEISRRTGFWDRQVLRDRQALGLRANSDSGRKESA